MLGSTNKDNQNRIKAFLLIKYVDWKYEQEFRIIFDHSMLVKNPVIIVKTQICEVIYLDLKLLNVKKIK